MVLLELELLIFAPYSPYKAGFVQKSEMHGGKTMSFVEHFNKLELVFTSEDAQLHYASKNALEKALNLAIGKGYIRRIKKNYYAVIDLATGEPYANKFQIASKLSEDAVVSHISAFQYHGFYNQVIYSVHYTTLSRNRNIIFEENDYVRHSPNIKDNSVGVIYDKWNHTRITDIERSILDSVYNINKVAGFEELIEVLEMLPLLNEGKMMNYLSQFKVNKTFIQRLGFLLEEFLSFPCSNELMSYLLCNKGNSTKYLFPVDGVHKGNTIYVKKWNLIVPRSILSMRGDKVELK